MPTMPARLLALAAILLPLAACQDDSARRQAATLSADEVAITYAIGGRGPAVVLIHCWGCNRGFYDEAVADLARDHRVVAVDLAGHGDSGGARDDFTIEAFAADVLAVMDAERVAEAVLVGHSMGGWVAMEIARRAPGRVRGIVGIDNLHKVHHGYSQEEFDVFLDAMRADFATAAPAHIATMFPEGTDPAVVRRATASVAAMPPEAGLSAMQNTFNYDLAPAAEAYGRPLYLVLDDARPADVDQWREHGVEVRVLPMSNVGHYPMFTAPEAFQRLLRQAVTAFATPSP
jgi:pimeloyl-ACP methyl ester carboxylesterase